ncbi:Integrin alpha-6 VLA-6 [Takifugu flavidus]|uniref:Integrin alpha-6 VLA-6 n=1 Tax=Takifugu flavidus TaxID=433684 RepID=A0A5C6MJE1_9TELE|nr:Integrin alpha-6 VLA-6 [Takifugu flavidus]
MFSFLQVLSSRSRSVTLFGYSLSGNLDVDDNLYPDLAVGSLSDSVFVYRARPVVRVSSTLRVTPDKIDITKEQCDKRTCYFTAQACFSYISHLESFNPKLILNYTFEADIRKSNVRLPPRVGFLGVPRGKLELPGQDMEICTDIKLRLLRDFKDRLHSIPVSVTMSLGSSTQWTSEHVTPILDRFQPNNKVSEITLLNTAAAQRQRQHCKQLHLQYDFCSRQTEMDKSCSDRSAAEDDWTLCPSVREDGVAVITPTEEDIALELTVTNWGGDDAHQTRSIISLPDTLRYSDIVSTASEPKVDCTVNDKGTLIDCGLGNPIQRDAEVTFCVMLTTSGISLSTKAVNITLQLQTTSRQDLKPVEAVAKVFFELKLQLYGLTRPSQVSFGQSLEGKSTIKSAEDIGAAVQYEFRITNLGRSLKSFTNASLNLFWPKENSAGKWLLYLSHTSSKGVQSVPCSPVNEIDHLKDVKTCTDGLRCVEIHCPLQGLDSTAMVVLHSRLWNTTFLEDYSSFNYLMITVDATLSLTNSPENTGLKSDRLSTQVKLTVFMEREIEYFTKVAWWIIFLTVIALLLLLAMMVFLLSMRGCIHWPTRNQKPQAEDPNQETLHLKDGIS